MKINTTLFNPLETGNDGDNFYAGICSWAYSYRTDDEIFLQECLVILMQMLQNYKTILMKCFITSCTSCITSNLQPHTGVLSIAKGLSDVFSTFLTKI